MIPNVQAGNVSFPGTLANPNPTPMCGAQNSVDDDDGTDDIPKESNHGTETLIYNHFVFCINVRPRCLPRLPQQRQIHRMGGRPHTE